MHRNKLIGGQTPPLIDILHLLQAWVLLALMLSSMTAEGCQQPGQQCWWKLKQMPVVWHRGSKCKLDVLLQFGIKWAWPTPKLQHHRGSLRLHLAGCMRRYPYTRQGCECGASQSPWPWREVMIQGSSRFLVSHDYLPFSQYSCHWSVGDPLILSRQVGSPECLGLDILLWRKRGRVKYWTGKTSKGYLLCHSGRTGRPEADTSQLHCAHTWGGESPI